MRARRVGHGLLPHVCGLAGSVSHKVLRRAQISREEQDIQGVGMMQRLQLQYDKELAFIEEQQRSVSHCYPPECALPASRPRVQ